LLEAAVTCTGVGLAGYPPGLQPDQREIRVAGNLGDQDRPGMCLGTQFMCTLACRTDASDNSKQVSAVRSVDDLWCSCCDAFGRAKVVLLPANTAGC
jgi:hypothetical protein